MAHQQRAREADAQQPRRPGRRCARRRPPAGAAPAAGRRRTARPPPPARPPAGSRPGDADRARPRRHVEPGSEVARQRRQQPQRHQQRRERQHPPGQRGQPPAPAASAAAGSARPCPARTPAAARTAAPAPSGPASRARYGCPGRGRGGRRDRSAGRRRAGHQVRGRVADAGQLVWVVAAEAGVRIGRRPGRQRHGRHAAGEQRPLLVQRVGDGQAGQLVEQPRQIGGWPVARAIALRAVRNSVGEVPRGASGRITICDRRAPRGAATESSTIAATTLPAERPVAVRTRSRPGRRWCRRRSRRTPARARAPAAAARAPARASRRATEALSSAPVPMRVVVGDHGDHLGAAPGQVADHVLASARWPGRAGRRRSAARLTW